MRKIDWERGNPYVWHEKDYDELINSEYLFARKFDENVDKNIIDKIYGKLMKSNKWITLKLSEALRRLWMTIVD